MNEISAVVQAVAGSPELLLQEPVLSWVVLAVSSALLLLSVLILLHIHSTVSRTRAAMARGHARVRSSIGGAANRATSAARAAASTTASAAAAAMPGLAPAAAGAAVPGTAVASRRGPVAQTMPGDMTKGYDPVDREFLPAALELLETPPSPVRVAGIWLICAGFAVALIWSYFGKLDIHAVAQGRIQPAGRSKVIQPVESGKVLAVYVENGSRVKAGDILVELDPTETGADRQAQGIDLTAARAEAARRRVAIDIAADAEDGDLRPHSISFEDGTSDEVRRREEQVLAGDLAQLRAQRANNLATLAERTAARDRLKASIEARAKVIALAKERVDMRTSLNEQGSLSRALVIEVLSQYETQVAQQVNDKGQLIETEAAINTVTAKIAEVVSTFISEQTGKLAEIERKADRIAQDLVKATAKNDHTTLRAPIAGTVQQLAVTTVGQVVGGAQALMTIVPTDGPIEIEALIQNQDIGFIEPDQDAIVKIESFPFTRYGTLHAKVTRVSRDAVEERDAVAMADPVAAVRPSGVQQGAGQKGPSLVFLTTLRLDKGSINIDGKDIPLSPGMAVTVEVLTGQRRAIDYVLAPLREVSSSSARER